MCQTKRKWVKLMRIHASPPFDVLQWSLWNINLLLCKVRLLTNCKSNIKQHAKWIQYKKKGMGRTTNTKRLLDSYWKKTAIGHSSHQQLHLSLQHRDLLMVTCWESDLSRGNMQPPTGWLVSGMNPWITLFGKFLSTILWEAINIIAQLSIAHASQSGWNCLHVPQPTQPLPPQAW